MAVGLFVVAFSIVGMHQLSLDHQLAAPTPPAASTVEAAAAGHPHASRHDHGLMGHASGPAPVDLVAVGSSSPHASVVVEAPHSSSSGQGEGCPDCGSHTMAFGACLLAFTLLVLSWWLAPPRVRLLPPRRAALTRTVNTVVGRRVPALSLAELSILRT